MIAKPEVFFAELVFSHAQCICVTLLDFQYDVLTMRNRCSEGVYRVRMLAFGLLAKGVVVYSVIGISLLKSASERVKLL